METAKEKDPMGLAIADYWKHGVAGRLRVFSPDFDEDEIPVKTLFRQWNEMSELEKEALQLAQGRILDVGAGAGCHSMALQEMGKDVTAIDISLLSVKVMQERGVEHALVQDFFALEGTFDTILMLMNGIGIVGTLARLPEFFGHLDCVLAEGGQVLFDSTDISYVFEDEDGIIDLSDMEGYYGEMEYQMQYKNVKGTPFPWLYVDIDTLRSEAQQHGYNVEPLVMGEDNNYLARICREKKE